MFLRHLSFALLIVAVSSAHAALVYDNATGATQLFALGQSHYFADDFVVGAPGQNLASTITGMNLGYVASAAGVFDIQVSFYKDMDLVTSAATPVLSNLVKTYTFSANAVAVGPNQTGLVTFADGGFNLGAISNFATSNHGISVKFLNSGTMTLDTNIVPLFKGDTPPLIGDSVDLYYPDLNNDGMITGDEATSFGGSPRRANIYMQLSGTINPVPEPASFGAMAIGAVALLRRRKRA